MTEIEWKAGDRVVHPGKPEWGLGSITAAEFATQDGRRCQRLTIRFENAGLKTVSTAFARLEHAARGSGAAESAVGRSWLEEAEAIDPAEQLAQLPERATDPFASVESRLKATLDLYRFSDTGSSLLAWASSQTGLSDPLSRLNRHELEQAFQRFRFALDRHLEQLLQIAAKQGVAPEDIAAAAPPEARQALQRANRRR